MIKFLFFILFIYIFPVLPYAQNNDRSILLKGIDSFSMTPDSIPVTAIYPVEYGVQIIAYGNLSDDSSKQLYAPAIVTSHYGSGKILAIGSNEYLHSNLLKNENIQRFWNNVFQWAGANEGKTIFNDSTFYSLKKLLPQYLFEYNNLIGIQISKNVKCICISKDIKDSTTLESIAAFIKNGGTVIYASDLWNEYVSSGYATYIPSLNPLLLKTGLYHVLNPINGKLTNRKLRFDSIPKYLYVDSILAHAYCSKRYSSG